MYTPRHFESRDDAHARRIIAEHPFATLITSVEGEAPHITHLPLLLEDGLLWGHMAKPNPHWQAFAHGRTVAVFHGPHCYISPRWYVEPEKNVPTWNYASVHVHGMPTLLDREGGRRVVQQITQHFDPGWTPAAEKVEKLLGGIVAFTLPLEKVEAKFKMNQNRTAADRAKVMQTLHASGSAEDAAVAGWIRLYDQP